MEAQDMHECVFRHHRIKVLEAVVARTRKDLERVDGMLRLTPTKPRLKKQKGAIEKIIFLAQAEIAKLRKRARPSKAPIR
jgi:hypothetical protein